MSELGLENLVKVAVHHDRCEKIQELSENVTKLKDLMKQNLGKLANFRYHRIRGVPFGNLKALSWS